jgi:lipoprotein-anchoring transpeptidase ErfK/SrfK
MGMFSHQASRATSSFMRAATNRLTTHTVTAAGRRVGVLAAALLAFAGAGVLAPAPANAATTAYRVESRLASLGYPAGTVDGVITVRTKQALCAWRETHGLPIGRYGLTSRDVNSILAATRRPYTSRGAGLYVNKTCQILYQVVDHAYRRIVWVSTGKPGYATPSGTGYVWRKWAGWHESSAYSGAWMYDSIYFRRDRPGIALHGSSSNYLVKPYPASHGCVRVWRPQIHYIFNETPIGRKVVVYGSYY